MGDDQKPDQKGAVDQSKLEKAPDKSVDPLKIAGDLARQELEFVQKTETDIAGKDYQKDKAAVQAKLAEKRADLIVSASAEAGVPPGEAPVDQSLAAMTPAEQSEMEAISAQAVEAKPTSPPENPTATVSPNPSANPAPLSPEAPKTPAATPPPEKSFGDKIKEFFASFIQKIKDWFSNWGKKTEPQKPEESPQPNPTDQPAPTNPDQVSQQPSNPEVLKGPDSTAGLTGDALLYNPQFKERAQQIANKIGVSLSDLYAIFKMEGVKNGKVDASAINPTSGASGLIQWMPRYAPKGTTIEEVRKMTGLQQLEYVDKHFSPWAGKIHTFADLYRTVFFPASIGKGKDYIFGSQDGKAALYAKENSGIARYAARSDGLIDNAGFEKYANSRRPKDSILNA